MDRRRIQLEHPLRELGLYNIEIRLMADVSATFQVAVVREGESWVEAEARSAAPAAQAEPAAEGETVTEDESAE